MFNASRNTFFDVGLPRHDLVRHPAVRITLFSRETEIGKLEFPFTRNQQVVRL